MTKEVTSETREQFDVKEPSVHSPLGKNIPHDSAQGHVSGQSVYIDDIPLAKKELLISFVGSPYAHGKLKSIDTSCAEKVTGVIGIFTHKDLGGHNCFGPIMQDEVLLVEDVAVFLNQPVVVIAAENKKALQQAKQLIRIEMEELPPVFTIDEAKEKKEFIGETRTIKRGDLDAGFNEADKTLEGVFYNNGQEHFYLESQSAVVYPDEFGTLTVHSSTQNPTEVQAVIAEVLGLQFNQVVVITKRMGGAFGGKECQATHFAGLAALAALKTQRPCRIVLTVDEDMKTTGKRHEFKNNYKVGFTKEGLITALSVDFFSNGGASNDLSTAVMGRAMCHVDNAYYIPNINITGTVCKTNLPPNTAFRGFGGPQGMACIESIIEDVAVAVSKDAADVRRLNCYGIEERNITPYGQTVENNKLPEIFDRLIESSEYKKRRVEIEAFNQNNPLKLRGLALTPMKFGISFNTKFLNQANALVNIYLDGTVQVSSGATEMGQGVNTKLQQLVADELCVPLSAVRVMPTSTEKNHNTSATAASSSSDLNGKAAAVACQAIRKRILDFLATHFDTDVEEIIWDYDGLYPKDQKEKTLSFAEMVKLAYLNRVDLGERGFYKTPGVEFHWIDNVGHGTPFLYYTTGCSVSEVEIDRFTGHLNVRRCDLLMDIGRPMNPGVDRGQVVGGFIQGMGWVTTEELRYDDKGDLLSHSPTTYKIPNIQDFPETFNVDFIENDENTVNIRGSKAVGEPPLMLALSVWAAVKNALLYVNDDLPELSLPATGEEILNRLTEANQNIKKATV